MSCLCNLFSGKRNRCHANFCAPSCNRTSPCMKTHCAAPFMERSGCSCCRSCCSPCCSGAYDSRRYSYGSLSNPYQDRAYYKEDDNCSSDDFC